MKVTGALLVLLACAYFRTTSAACQRGLSVLVNDEVDGKPRSALLVTFGNGEQVILTKPRDPLLVTRFRVSAEQGNTFKMNRLVSVDLGVFRSEEVCEHTLDEAINYKNLQCGALTLLYRCM